MQAPDGEEISSQNGSSWQQLPWVCQQQECCMGHSQPRAADQNCLQENRAGPWDVWEAALNGMSIQAHLAGWHSHQKNECLGFICSLHKGTVFALTEAVVINTDFSFLAMTISSPSVPQGIIHFPGELLVRCKYKMASPMAHVTVLLSQLCATKSTGTDDFDNPTSDDLNKMEVLGSMLICFPFFLRFLTAETKRTSRVQVHPLHTLFMTVYRDLIKMCL